jgi:hypothetical protein
MHLIIIAVIAAAIAAIVPPLIKAKDEALGAHIKLAIRIVAAFVIVVCLTETSIVSVPANEVGIVRKIYGSTNLPDGKLIATNGETGYQAEIVPPGTWKLSLLFNVLNELKIVPLVTVPQGFYGRIVARDGESLGKDQVMADAWDPAHFNDYLRGEYFLKNGGQKGLQLSILKPGTYPLNLALFEVRIGYEPNNRDITKSTDDVYTIDGKSVEQSPMTTAITRIPAGSVGVVKSSVQDKGSNCIAIKTKVDIAVDSLVADLVPEGCIGVWNKSLMPGDYYLNRDAYYVTEVSTRVTTLEFKGGFTRRYIDLKVGAGGDYVQTEHAATFNKPEDAADVAVNTKIEGWEIPQELRAVVQITPENAPIVVAAVGGQKEVDERILIPSIRSNVRNVYGGSVTVPVVDDKGQPVLDANGNPTTITRPTKVLDTIEQRQPLEAAILALAKIDGRRAGVDIKEIRLGESAIPPELLLARQRQQLATQLTAAFIQEQAAQTQRQQTEQARATADQQKDLVTAQIKVQTAKLMQEQRQAEGHAERLFLEEQAAGQAAQTAVLGKDSVLLLQQMKMGIDLFAAHPELLSQIKLPQTLVIGGSSGLEGPAAVLGQAFRNAAPVLPAAQ